MKKVRISLVLLFFCCLTVPAQSNDEKLAKLSTLIQDEISREMSGWSCKPFKPSTGVIIQHWSSGEIGVKISVIDFASPTKAAGAFKEAKSDLRVQEVAAANRGRELHIIKEESLNLGDEGFIWDIRGSDAVEFRKGELIVNVSVFSPVQAKDVYFSRKFAALVAAALNSL
jgi:hypothetical protein